MLNRMVFTPGASAFTLTIGPYTPAGPRFFFTGTGIENDSGIPQGFLLTNLYEAGLIFTNQATAGIQTIFTAERDSDIQFFDESSAGSGTFTIEGNPLFLDGVSMLEFYDNSSAASAIVINGGGTGFDAEGGVTVFVGNSTAANGTFTNMAGTDTPTYPSVTVFGEDSSAADSVIINEGGAVSSGVGGVTEFFDQSTAANATITCQGAQLAGAYSGIVAFFETASGGSATLVANDGVNGGEGGTIRFFDTSDGGQSRVELFGNGKLDVTFQDSPGLTIGSLEGDGIVLLDTHNLTIGTNGLSTTFSGVIQDSGTITKVGAGTLTLAGANTYSGGTTVSDSFLKVANTAGSATGTGPVEIEGGILGGGGIIAGPVTMGNGSGSRALLAPGTGSTTLTLQSSLTFKADGTYTWRVNTNSVRADKVIGNGVTIESGAQFDPMALGNAQLPLGTTFTAISNTSGMPITGTFSNLPDGATITIGNNTFQADYEGGDGNDLTLTVVP